MISEIYSKGAMHLAQPLLERALTLCKVIVLDDDQIDQERISRALQSVGIVTAICRTRTLDEFAENIAAQTFDFAFIDFNLSEGTGLDALKLLMALDTPKPVLPIMISGDIRTEVAVQAMKDGCKDYLSKENLSPEALRMAMSDALRGKTPSPVDEAILSEQVQSVMQVIDDAALSDLRPRISRMLRLIRQVRNTDRRATSNEGLQKLDEMCLELQKYCEAFSKEVSWRSKTRH